MNSTIDTSRYWKLLGKTLLSPGFHLKFMKSRFQSNFISAPKYRLLMSIIYWLCLVCLVTWQQWWIPFLIVFVFPLTVLFHVSSLLQFISEHLWECQQDVPIKQKSHSRFCADPLPLGLGIKHWLRWLIRIPYHLLVRLTIITGNLPVHSYHHNSPNASKDWANDLYAYQREVETGVEYVEFYDLVDAIDAVFQSMAAPPAQAENQELN